MSTDELVEFLAQHLRIRLEDCSTPDTCGGDVRGELRIKAELQLLIYGWNGQPLVISSDIVSLG
jgi:hypothetical protein